MRVYPMVEIKHRFRVYLTYVSPNAACGVLCLQIFLSFYNDAWENRTGTVPYFYRACTHPSSIKLRNFQL